MTITKERLQKRLMELQMQLAQAEMEKHKVLGAIEECQAAIEFCDRPEVANVVPVKPETVS